MTVRYPNRDLPGAGLGGGRDAWDSGQAGAILSSDFFIGLSSPSFTATQANTSATETTSASLAWAADGLPAPTIKVQRLSAGGGASPTLVQSTPVGAGYYGSATATFPSPVTPGNTIVVMGSVSDLSPLSGNLTTNQGDTFTHHRADLTAYVAGFISHATAVGGSTTITLGTGEAQRFVAQEWSGLTFDSAAGVGSVSGTAGVTPATPNASSVASSVSFSALCISAGGSYAAQAIATGFTEAGRSTPAQPAQFVAGYRVETTTGIKSAAWVDPGIYGDDRIALVLVFNASATPPAWEDVAAGTNFTGPSPLSYITPVLDDTFDGAQYRAVATNSAGSVNSASMTLTVTDGVAPTITLNPVSQEDVVGDTVTFTAAATGTAPITGQWQVLRT